jgi:hypothetical protein
VESDNPCHVLCSFKQRNNLFRANLRNQRTHTPSFSYRLLSTADQLWLKDLAARPISESSGFRDSEFFILIYLFSLLLHFFIPLSSKRAIRAVHVEIDIQRDF